MDNINIIFFNEYKKLEKICNEMYDLQNGGVTQYIKDMENASYMYYKEIPNWKEDLLQMKQIRHIRNILAHEQDSFNQTLCSAEEINWIDNFYNRILTQSDPLSLHYQLSKQYRKKDAVTNDQISEKYTKPLQQENSMYEEYKTHSLTNTDKTILLFVILILIALFLSSFVYLFAFFH